MFAPLVVRVGLVAEPEIAASPADASAGPTASTSWLPDGPITATALEEMIACVFVVAIDGVSCVSSCASVTLVPSALLSAAMAALAPASCSRPSCATGPVSGASIASDALHAAAAAFAGWAELVAPKTVADASAITPTAPAK